MIRFGEANGQIKDFHDIRSNIWFAPEHCWGTCPMRSPRAAAMHLAANALQHAFTSPPRGGSLCGLAGDQKSGGAPKCATA